MNDRVGFNGMGRTTLSEVENDLMPGEDDLSGKVTDNRQKGVRRQEKYNM